jgi:hypothetical protein
VSCSDDGCARAGGCGTRKGGQRALIARALARLYPTGTWGELDDEARFRRGLGRGGALRLARGASEALKAPTLLVEGGPDELCDFLYVLCVGREPGLIAVREGREALEPGAEELDVRERYLRVALSSLARLAAVQEVEVTLERDGGQLWIREAPRAGVYDPILLKRFQKLVDLVGAHGAAHLDMGLLDAEPVGMEGAAYQARYGRAPRIVNYLFYPSPTTTARISAVGAGGRTGEAPSA